MSATPQPLLDSSSPPPLDPPFRGYIETTYDSLLVFEAARRGMIPRVTRRLIERERGMVQSGAIFVFDEHESGIKRWTDGLIWSPSRILGNFLVYRETDKRSANSSANNSSLSTSPTRPSSPQMAAPGSSSRPGTGTATDIGTGAGQDYAESSQMGASHSASSISELPALSVGAIRPRSTSEGGLDRHRERQLVGSLTNSYKFKDGGLVKKTMSVTVNGYAQHMVSYYTIEDVISGRLRAPSTIPELAALEISPEYLQKQNYRFPPMVEFGQDGVPRYRGEAEETMPPNTALSGLTMHQLPPRQDPYDPYGNAPLSMDPPRHSHSRASTQPSPLHLSASSHGSHQMMQHPYLPHSATAPGPPASYYDSTGSSSLGGGSQPVPIQRQVSSSSTGGAIRPNSAASRRFDPYGGSPRGLPSSAGGSFSFNSSPNHPLSAGSTHLFPPAGQVSGQFHRRQSVPVNIPQPSPDYYTHYDIKPIIHPSGAASYDYHPTPSSATTGSFSDLYPGQAQHQHQQQQPLASPVPIYGQQNQPPSQNPNYGSGQGVGSSPNAPLASPMGSQHSIHTPTGFTHQLSPSHPGSHHQHHQYQGGQSGNASAAPTWQPTPITGHPSSALQSRLIPAQREYPPSSSGSGSSGSAHGPPGHHPIPAPIHTQHPAAIGGGLPSAGLPSAGGGGEFGFLPVSTTPTSASGHWDRTVTGLGSGSSSAGLMMSSVGHGEMQQQQQQHQQQQQQGHQSHQQHQVQTYEGEWR